MAAGVTTRRVGPGRLVVALYLLFVVAAGSRSAVQLATAFSVAPAAYLLSAVAAVVYAVQLVLLVRVERGAATGTAVAWAVVEFAGVAVVGTVALLVDLGDTTVWSDFGQGYLYLPAVLPVLALGWLVSTRDRSAAAQPSMLPIGSRFSAWKRSSVRPDAQ